MEIAKGCVLFAKVSCKGGLLKGRWTDKLCVCVCLPVVRAECTQTKVGRGEHGLDHCRKNMPLQKPPPADGNLLDF